MLSSLTGRNKILCFSSSSTYHYEQAPTKSETGRLKFDSKTITPLNRPSSSHKGTKDTYPLTHQGESTPSENTYMSCMRVVWNSPIARGISGNALSVILQSWRGSTHNHLLTNFIYRKKWLFFRGSRDLNPCKATPLQSLDLMTDLEVE